MDERIRADLRERLRRLGVRRGTSHLRSRPAPHPTSVSSLEHTVGGREVVTSHGTLHIRDVVFPHEHCHGHYPLGRILSAPLAPLPDLLIPTGSPPVPITRMAFLDTETTGLSGGTGTVAFLVGVGFIEEGGVRVRQYFLRDLDEEPAMLDQLAEDLVRADIRAIVTYNGRGFDVPLLETRYLMNAMPSPLSNTVHLDLLIHVRRLWRPRIRRCSLAHVEQHILAHQRDVLDVPGWLIPHMYRQYLYTRDPQPLRQVFYHNLHDILSLVALTDILLRAWHDPWSEPVLAPEDFLARARYLMETGDSEAAKAALRHTLHHAHDQDIRQRAYTLLSRLLKREQRWDEAVALWEQWLAEFPQEILPYEELAKYHEWQTGNITLALTWTERALAIVNNGNPIANHRWRAALEHRRARLIRKAGRRVEAREAGK